MSQSQTFLEFINSHSPETNKSSEAWYPRYTQTYQEIAGDPESPPSLEKLWAMADNSVASIRQAILSGDEYTKAKDYLAEITANILSSPSHATYSQALSQIEDLKQKRILKRRYVAVLNRVFAALHPEKVTSTVIDDAFNTVARYLNEKFDLKLSLKGDWYIRNTELKAALSEHLPTDYDPIRLNVALWNVYQALQNRQAQNEAQESNNNAYNSSIKVSQPLNQILFGPPGTGKTFTTIKRAVRAAEPSFTWADRDGLKTKYQELIRKGRIRFVTFHQSFSYEDFVEGLTAHTDNGNLVYEKRLGIFRQIVKAAKEYQVSEVKDAATSFDESWEAFLTKLEDRNDGISIKTRRSNFTVTEVDANTIRFDKSQGQSVHTLSVTSLEAVFNGDREIKGGLQPYYESLVRRLKEIGSKLNNKKVERQNFVLIIDEINRGNISRIFGELITLIEPSKRSGATEALEVTLPLTGDRFSVPDNLYIIGTMNTADRSLAGLDLALRRRFDFIEMPPLSEELKGIIVEGIDVEKILDVINRRITALLDKNHCIGHAYFIHLRDNSNVALTDLAEVFQQKIIPLLQEYFFEDWQRIRWVFNDQSKSNEHAFIVKDDAISFDELFPGDVPLNSRDRWRLNESAFEYTTSYKQIYEVGSTQ
ncbi:AAA family ATPase [Aliidiomarina sedimenti]|uniref:AAA family ATPase n=1 Tax=Aliidiomarina sedimenti TaxID=1933879 RepID=A0ABY0BXR1_9GAMM|nr:AAA family ATPase [Aliidiomarina sedimenti]RUO29234.1 AAA family ATPase [Aliidiomarina sedimenti]